MIVLLGVGYAVMGLSPEVLMLVSAAIAGVIAIYLGYTWDDICCGKITIPFLQRVLSYLFLMYVR